MAPIMKDSINDLMSKLATVEGKDDLEIYQLYKGLTMDVIGRTAFGIVTQVQNNPENNLFLQYAQGSVTTHPIVEKLYAVLVSFPEIQFFLTPLIMYAFKMTNKGKNPRVGLNEEVTKVIHARKKDPKSKRPDLLQLLLDTEMTEEQMDNATLTAGEDDVKETDSKTDSISSGSSKNVKRLTEEEIENNASVFFIAGYETTSTSLAFTTYLLAKHQDIQEKVRKEILEIVEANGEISYTSVQKLKYLDAVCNEALRLYPPVHMLITREPSDDIQCGKYAIPKGVSIQIPAYTLHHDPEYWPDPETFNPDRFLPENKSNINPFAFQGFGGGPRNCIGMRFAQMELKLALATILLKYRLLPGKSFEKDLKLYNDLVLLRPKNGVRIRLENIS